MIIENTFTNLAGRSLTGVLSLAATAILARCLAPAHFGLLMLVRSIIGAAGLLESAFGMGITRYVAYFHGRGERGPRDRIATVGLLANLAQGALAALVLAVLTATTFVHVFARIPSELLEEGRLLLYVFLGVLALQLGAASAARILEGLQAYPTLRAGESLVQALTVGLLAAYFAIGAGYPLRYLAGIYLVVEALRFAGGLALVRVHGVEWHPFRSLDGRLWRQLLNFGKPILVAKIFTALSYRGDAVLLGIFLGVESVAEYQVASQVWLAATGALAALTVPIFPAVAHRAAQRPSEVRTLFLRASRCTLGIALCISTLVGFASGPLIDYWVGGAYAGARQLVVLFMVQAAIAFHQGVSGLVVMGMSTHHPLGRVEAFGSVVNFGISLLLIRQLGAAGVVIGAVAKAIFMAVLYTRLALNTLEVAPSEFLREAIWPAWRLLALSLAVALGLRRLGGFSGMGEAGTILETCLLGLVMALLMWFTVLDHADRKRLRAALAW